MRIKTWGQRSSQDAFENLPGSAEISGGREVQELRLRPGRQVVDFHVLAETEGGRY